VHERFFIDPAKDCSLLFEFMALNAFKCNLGASIFKASCGAMVLPFIVSRESCLFGS